MRPGFHHRLVNGPFEDPCLLVKPAYERRSLLFDAGDIGRLPQGDIYRITDVFVTHTHIDHFIGFDLLLRVMLRRETPMNIYGPPALVSCVQGKLRGYAWNLIRKYPAVINVSCFDGKTVSRTRFRAANSFKKEDLGRSPSDGLLLETDRYRVRAARMSHRIPCLAYALEEDLHINIDKDLLLRRGLQVGPWLNAFKRAYRQGDRSQLLDAGGRKIPLGDLAGIAIETKGQKISYATDLSLTAGNLRRLTGLIRNSDVFYGEAFFLERDRQKALERSHLTARTCGEVARAAGVRNLVVMHFSPRYAGCPELLVNEALSAFRGETTVP